MIWRVKILLRDVTFWNPLLSNNATASLTNVTNNSSSASAFKTPVLISVALIPANPATNLTISLYWPSKIFKLYASRIILSYTSGKIILISEPKNKSTNPDSINNLIDKLGGSFCKTHQSCIINLNNIKSIDLANNMVIFENGLSTNMLTNKMKKVVKDCVGVN